MGVRNEAGIAGCNCKCMHGCLSEQMTCNGAAVAGQNLKQCNLSGQWHFLSTNTRQQVCGKS